MTLAQRTNVLLLDEPTTFLDIVHQLEVMELVKRLNEEFGMTIIMVLHDINQAAQYSDRLLVLKRGSFSMTVYQKKYYVMKCFNVYLA